MKSRRMSCVVVICVYGCFHTSGFAATQAAELSCSPQHTADLAALAQGMEPEFSVDLLLRLLSVGKMDRQERIRLLRDAFQMAGSAKYAVRLRSAGGTATDSRSSSISQALAPGYDQLSLKCRVVQAALSLRPPLARELFGEITFPELKGLKCSDALIYDVSSYYQTLTAVIERALSPADLKRGDHVLMLEDQISRIRSPFQVGPLCSSLKNLAGKSKLRPSELVGFAISLAGSLKQMRADDRSFSTTVYSVVDGVGALLAECQRAGMPCTSLLESLKVYLERHMAAPACAGAPPDRKPDAIVASFGRVRKLDPGGDTVPKLQPTDLRLEGLAPDEGRYWRDETPKSLLTVAQALRFGSGRKPLTNEARQAPEWEAQWRALIEKVAAWQQGSANVTDYFHQKAILFFALIDLPQDIKLRQEALERFFSFLASSPVAESSPAEWLLEVDRALAVAKRGPGADALLADFRELMARSGRPLLTVRNAVENLIAACGKPG